MGGWRGLLGPPRRDLGAYTLLAGAPKQWELSQKCLTVSYQKRTAS